MGSSGEAVARLGAILADHDVAFIEQNAILAHLEAILADWDAIWANNNRLECHENVKLFFAVILRLSKTLVRFRASGDNFLRSITRGIVNENKQKRQRNH